ncbi:HAD-IIB family hydrolase [Salipiger sp. IMCC34102]|nr:HAD-IIB family hydrolase [Salipiger sp. IMCC34102]
MTEDTGGHIAFVLGAAAEQAALDTVRHVTIVTRGFEDPRLGPGYARDEEPFGPKCTIRRLFTENRAYLAKEALDEELPRLEQAFLRMLEEGPRPDLIHAHFADAARLARAAQERFGIPWAYTPHSLGIDKARTGAAGPELSKRIDQERAAILHAGAVITSSRDEAERQVAAYGIEAQGRVHRVDPGVDAIRTTDTRAARRLIAPFLRDPDKPIVLGIARPVRKKNLAGVLRGYASDPTLRERANLVILSGLRDGLTDGCAEQRAVIAELFDLADRNDLWGSIAMPRQHAPEDVHSLYALAAQGGVFVSPAYHEPFGLTVVEAAQAGVPVVATRHGGPPSIVEQIGAGALVDPGDDAEIGRAIAQMLQSDARANERARLRARAVYSWPGWVRRVDGIYRDLLAAPAPVFRADLLLASDIDDTLTGDRDGAAAFGRWLSAHPSVSFAVVTGRCVSEARRVLADWALPVPRSWITSVGTEIWRPDGKGGLAMCDDYATAISDGWDVDGISAALSDLGLTAQDGYEQRPWKRSFLGTVADARRIEVRLAQAGFPARVIPSHDRFIDVIPARAGKAAAVRFELDRIGLPERSCIVAGDSGNDADMLAELPLAVAPSNARAEIDHIAHPGLYRATRPHAHGVIEGIEAHMARRPMPLVAE